MQRRKCKVAKTKDIALLRSWKGNRMKQIQIPEQLFMELVKFHLLDMEENLPSIKQGLEAKLASLVMRDLYSKYNDHRGRTGTGEKRISGQTRSAGEIPLVNLP